jgi:exodeoxyribonuclease VII small subunit
MDLMSTNSPDLTPIQSLTYEQSLAELETLVATLESERQPLAEAIALFERGQELAQHCATLLDQAELKIQQLTADGLSDFVSQT